MRLRAVRFHLRNVLQTHQGGQTSGPQEPRRAGAAGQWVWLQRTTVKGPADGNCLLCDGSRAATLGVTLHEGVTRHHRWGRSVPLHSTAQNYFLQLHVNVQSSPRQNLVKKKKKKDTRLLIPVPEVTKQTERRPYFTRSGFPSRLPGPWRPAGRWASRAHPACAQGPREAEGERPGRKRGLPRAQGRLALPGPVPSSL